MSVLNIASLIWLVLQNQTELMSAVTDSRSDFGWLIKHVIEIVIERGARSRPMMNEIITNCRTATYCATRDVVLNKHLPKSLLLYYFFISNPSSRTISSRQHLLMIHSTPLWKYNWLIDEFSSSLVYFVKSKQSLWSELLQTEFTV